MNLVSWFFVAVFLVSLGDGGDSQLIEVDFNTGIRELTDVEVILFALTVVKLMALVVLGVLPIRTKLGKRSLPKQTNKYLPNIVKVRKVIQKLLKELKYSIKGTPP